MKQQAPKTLPQKAETIENTRKTADILIGAACHIKTLKPQWFQGFSLSQKQCLALFLALRHKKTRTSAGTDPLKTKIVFMLRYQYSRIGRENQSQGFILPAEFECTAPFGRRWPSSSDL